MTDDAMERARDLAAMAPRMDTAKEVEFARRIAAALREAEARGYRRAIEEAAKEAETETYSHLPSAPIAKTIHTLPRHPDLDALIEQARDTYAAMSPEEKEAMHQVQRESWVRGNIGIDRGPDARRTITGETQTADTRADRSPAGASPSKERS